MMVPKNVPGKWFAFRGLYYKIENVFWFIPNYCVYFECFWCVGHHANFWIDIKLFGLQYCSLSYFYFQSMSICKPLNLRGLILKISVLSWLHIIYEFKDLFKGINGGLEYECQSKIQRYSSLCFPLIFFQAEI